MWTTSQPLNAKISPRPARLAYLIPEQPSDELLDAVIAECLSRWGGRRTPIIPTDGDQISPAYWALLDLWDADIIYSYIRLSEGMENRIYDLFAPSEIRIHGGLVDHADAHGFRPDYEDNYSFVSSLSLLPAFARFAQVAGAKLPDIVDKERWAEEDRDLDDTFGFVSNNSGGTLSLPHARRLTLRSKRHRSEEAGQFSTNKVSYVDNIEEFVATIAKGRSVLTLSRLADTLCPHLHHLTHGKERWDDHLTIVIGDGTHDRLLFWNAQHRYPALNIGDDIPVLRFSPKRFESGPPDWLMDWIAVRNHRSLNGIQVPQTILRSCSIANDRLNEIAGELSANGMVMVSSEHHPNPCLFESCEHWTSGNRVGTVAKTFPSIWTHPRVSKGARVHFQNNQFEVPLAPPWHIDNFVFSSLSRGIWAVDLTIERTEDHSRFANPRDVWKFPRRLRLEQAIGFENYARDIFALLPPARPTENGDLTIWDSASWTRPVLSLPSDYDAFVSSIARLPPGSPSTLRGYESGSRDLRFDRVMISDKGRDLLGVLQFFQSLPEALDFLTDRFWLDVINRLSPEETALKEKNIRKVAEKLKNLAETDTQSATDYESLAGHALHLATRSLASQVQQLKVANFDELRSWAIPDRGNKVSQALNTSTTYLRNRLFLLQGFRWVCSFCQHHNWVPLEGLAAISLCEICRKSESSPVSGSLHFRLNAFVQHAFASSSAQGPVIWCLEQLAHRAAWSFSFAPALLLDDDEGDLDIVANVDGKVYMVEVKSSFSNVGARIMKQLNNIAVKLRPDVVMLAVKKNKPNDAEFLKLIAALQKDLQDLDVQFELLTLDSARPREAGHEIAAPGTKKMNWSEW